MIIFNYKQIPQGITQQETLRPRAICFCFVLFFYFVGGGGRGIFKSAQYVIDSA